MCSCELCSHWVQYILSQSKETFRKVIISAWSYSSCPHISIHFLLVCESSKMKLKKAVCVCACVRVHVYMCICVCACVLYCGNFLSAPCPWLMDTSCVLCLALSLQIYIKQCNTASVSLHLCCTCHLNICLAASQLLSLSGIYQDPQLISSLIPAALLPPTHFSILI